MEPGTVPVGLDGLPDYIRAYNKSSKNKLSIVSPKKGRKLECPVTLRFMIPNVVTVYLTLDHPTQSRTALIVENATAIGSREQVRVEFSAPAVWFAPAHGIPSSRNHLTPNRTIWPSSSSLSSWQR